MTVANLFAKHRAGDISKEKFLYEVRKDAQLPFISNLTSYDDAIKILKQKSVIKEAQEADTDSDYLEFSDGETVVSMHKDGGKWIEGDVIEGEKPYGWGGKTYMSYLSPKEIARYLRQDYGGDWQVSDENTDYSDEPLDEAKNTSKSILKEQADLFLTIDRMNPILINKAVNVELAKLPEINATIYQKTLEKVVNKLKKDPRYYDDVFVSNAKEINKVDEKRKMIPVKKELKDPHHQMKSPKGIEKHKANTKTSTKENKKGKPKGVKEMSSIAKGHKGVKQMKQPEKKHRVMEAIETFLKKKLTEDSHHVYGIGMGVETPDGPGTIKAIVGSTLTVELGEGKHKDYQMNIINHYSGHHDSVPNELDNAKIKKFDAKAKPGVKTMDEKKDDVIKKVMEFLKKKKKKEVDEVATAKTTDAAHNQSVLNKLNKVQGPARADMQKAFNSGQAIDI